MFLLEIAIISIIIGLIRKGSIKNFFTGGLRGWYIFLVAIILFLGVSACSFAGVSVINNYAFWIITAAYILTFIGLIMNLDGVWSYGLLLGCLLNFVIIVLNSGFMPVSSSALNIAGLGGATDAYMTRLSATHQIATSSTIFLYKFIGAIVPVPLPSVLGEVLSPGTLLAGLSLFGLIQSVMTTKYMDEDEYANYMQAMSEDGQVEQVPPKQDGYDDNYITPNIADDSMPSENIENPEDYDYTQSNHQADEIFEEDPEDNTFDELKEDALLDEQNEDDFDEDDFFADFNLDEEEPLEDELGEENEEYIEDIEDIDEEEDIDDIESLEDLDALDDEIEEDYEELGEDFDEVDDDIDEALLSEDLDALNEEGSMLEDEELLSDLEEDFNENEENFFDENEANDYDDDEILEEFPEGDNEDIFDEDEDYTDEEYLDDESVDSDNEDNDLEALLNETLGEDTDDDPEGEEFLDTLGRDPFENLFDTAHAVNSNIVNQAAPEVNNTEGMINNTDDPEVSPFTNEDVENLENDLQNIQQASDEIIENTPENEEHSFFEADNNAANTAGIINSFNDNNDGTNTSTPVDNQDNNEFKEYTSENKTPIRDAKEMLKQVGKPRVGMGAGAVSGISPNVNATNTIPSVDVESPFVISDGRIVENPYYKFKKAGRAQQPVASPEINDTGVYVMSGGGLAKMDGDHLNPKVSKEESKITPPRRSIKVKNITSTPGFINEARDEVNRDSQIANMDARSILEEKPPTVQVVKQPKHIDPTMVSGYNAGDLPKTQEATLTQANKPYKNPYDGNSINHGNNKKEQIIPTKREDVITENGAKVPNPYEKVEMKIGDVEIKFWKKDKE